jgi:hypothetical protein
MEILMWIVVWTFIAILAVASIPVLVVGTWYVVMTVVLGVADVGIWILDGGSRRTRGRANQPPSTPPIESTDTKGKQMAMSTLSPRSATP